MQSTNTALDLVFSLQTRFIVALRLNTALLRQAALLRYVYIGCISSDSRLVALFSYKHAETCVVAPWPRTKSTIFVGNTLLLASYLLAAAPTSSFCIKD